MSIVKEFLKMYIWKVRRYERSASLTLLFEIFNHLKHVNFVADYGAFSSFK